MITFILHSRKAKTIGGENTLVVTRVENGRRGADYKG